jgi:hypothetical protein
MRSLIVALLLVVCFVPYLAEQGWIPAVAKYLEEGIALVVALYVVVVGARSQFRNVRAEYWFLFAAIVAVMVCGIVINAVGSGPIFAGLRSYLRAVPLFLLPAVFTIEDKVLKRQLLLLLAISFVQVPTAIYQRMTRWAAGHISGDWVIGTVMNSGILTIFLICVACILTGFYMRKRIKLVPYLGLMLIVLTPTMFNETKATLVLLPIGILTTLIAGARPGQRLSNAFSAFLVLAVFTAIFIPVYDYYVKPRWGYGLVDFITMPGRVEGYLEKRGAAIGAVKQVGRVDAVTVPLKEFSSDPPKLAFGLGIGNASDSSLGKQFTGEYFRRYEPFGQSTAAILILETGVLGLALVLLLHLMIFRDAKAVAARDQGLYGAFAAGWTGVMAVMMISLFYKNMTPSGSVAFTFWYFAGVVAARRMRLRDVARAAAPRRAGIEPRPDAIA